MTFPLVWTSGVANGQTIPGSEFEQLDEDHSKSINGVDGDTVNGHIEFTDVELTGTSSINCTGNIVTTGFGLTLSSTRIACSNKRVCCWQHKSTCVRGIEFASWRNNVFV